MMALAAFAIAWVEVKSSRRIGTVMAAERSVTSAFTTTAPVVAASVPQSLETLDTAVV